MASTTMTTSFLGGGVIISGQSRSTISPPRLVVVKASSGIEGEQVKLNCNNIGNKKDESNSGRRDLMFVAAAAAVCSIAGVAFANEPKPGSPEAKKKYAPICVTMPTARICRN